MSLQKKYTTSDRLKQLMEERGLKQIDIIDACQPFCKKFGIKIGKNDLSQYVSGKVQPRQDKLSILGMALGVSETWLMGYDNVPSSNSNGNEIFIPKLKKVPLLGKTACGEPIYSPNFDDGFALIGDKFDVDFALEAKGDSMTGAGINDGDVVFFKAQEMVENGQIAAVSIDGEVTLKRVYYYRDSNKMVLQPENPAYEPLIYLNEELNAIRIIGRSVAHLRCL